MENLTRTKIQTVALLWRILFSVSVSQREISGWWSTSSSGVSFYDGDTQKWRLERKREIQNEAKQDHLRMNVALGQTMTLGLQIFLDHRSLSSIDEWLS